MASALRVTFMKRVVMCILTPVAIVGYFIYCCGKTLKERYHPEVSSEEEGEGGGGEDLNADYDPYVGAEVVLKNLTKLEYNGLKGRLLKYIEGRELRTLDDLCCGSRRAFSGMFWVLPC